MKVAMQAAYETFMKQRNIFTIEVKTYGGYLIPGTQTPG